MTVKAAELDGDGDIFDLDYQETPEDGPTGAEGTLPTPFETTTPLWTPTPLITPTPIR